MHQRRRRQAPCRTAFSSEYSDRNGRNVCPEMSWQGARVRRRGPEGRAEAVPWPTARGPEGAHAETAAVDVATDAERGQALVGPVTFAQIHPWSTRKLRERGPGKPLKEKSLRSWNPHVDDRNPASCSDWRFGRLGLPMTSRWTPAAASVPALVTALQRKRTSLRARLSQGANRHMRGRWNQDQKSSEGPGISRISRG